MKLFRTKGARIADLEAENDALVDSAKTMRDDMQNRINALVDEKHRLRIQADACARALRMKQAELDKTLAAFKELDADYIEACGRLSDAEERLAGYKRVTT